MTTVEIAPEVCCIRDTCNVYALRAGSEAVLIDFGSGAVLDRLGELGIERVTDVLLTHHHRDQVQGLGRATANGTNVWAPPFDAPLVADVDLNWQTRPLDVDYDLREDRFSAVESIEVAGTVPEYRSARFGAFEITTLPTPGHTPGSVTYLVEIEGKRLAFVGDLLSGDGKVWSLAATQWSYSGVEGQESTIVSLAELAKHEPDLLLPSHGEPIDAVDTALANVRARLGELVALRMVGEWTLEDRLRSPFHRITPHLWRNRTTFANSYVLVSDSGAALGIDFGYDMATWRRPLLWSLAGRRVDAVVTTHFHDDHVAGLNLLRDVEGTEVWAPANVAPVLEEPHRYDLPCLWPDPIRVDRLLPLGESFRWNEYELTPHPLPGHTLYAAAVEFEVDGRRVLATGDQYGLEGERAILNYQYRNRFRRGDFVDTGALVRRLEPDLLIGGHWLPLEVTREYLDRMERDASRLAALHDELLPQESFGEAGFGARIEPYRSTVAAGQRLELDVIARNPFDHEASVVVTLALPAGWDAEPRSESAGHVAAHGEVVLRFAVEPAPQPTRRARVAAELVVDGMPFGQQAEALVDVT
jgi:glyoxylase-like metal-dependent hydrolase (beta-lactamase superfamily II)